MGFSDVSPVLTTESVLRTIDEATPRSDAAEMAPEVPYQAMLAGTSAEEVVRTQYLGVANLYRSRGMMLVINVGPANGLARDLEAPQLLALHRSITEPAIQLLYRKFVTAVDTIIHPDYLGFAVETNLIRLASPGPVYQAMKVMANVAAGEARARGTAAKLFVSVQVDVAWGRLGGATPTYAGIAQDLTDFPFINVVGLSSYPYLSGFATPEEVPLNYYSRLATDAGRPVLVAEGGWSSTTASPYPSSPALQARYIHRQMDLLDAAHAIAVFQLTYTDIDPVSYGSPAGLSPFIYLGLVDKDFHPKPALAAWDSAFARPRASGAAR
ncbi:MAG: hypothetical protein M3081_22990 [Gemmatimonadota bacterium]|nr:hypothetical protein [Gemmatimonadota bacterium]